ncbi:uncharacterized protein STEHIDRAFT_120025 [Stereum hirsutum FP-91666 SS1]|uniref:uncharacterized protein n=1 Tax=Stereum hirsutum (strain FP-91666) TaxID=721885 RepID=UPI000440A986|nr:uncharacterized protein STEHIDRAFT_120025 [Stereum hirsutum FP-91666 SS1]EIM89389.1 hypothetical protein STEHIDRAFT_120025 [Stereum hirsutum FP-91666 SS1]
MPSRAVFLAPGVICLFIAFVLSLLVSISLPTLPALDITRTHYDTDFLENGGDINGVHLLGELRLGIWAYCGYSADNGDKTCIHQGHGYTVNLPFIGADDSGSNPVIGIVTIGSSWTRGLAVHPVATAVIGIAFILSLSSNLAIELASSIVSLLAAFLTLLAFIIDIALYAHTKHEMHAIDQSKTVTAPGFWLTFVSLVMLIIASFTVCIGRRRHLANEDPFADNKGIRLAFWKR